MIEERQVTEKEGLEAKKDFILKHLRIPMASNFVNTTIKDTGIYSKYHCLVVGLERGGQRSKSPKSDHIILGGDIIWIIGSASNIQKLTDDLIQSV